jgi:hypothetical protein
MSRGQLLGFQCGPSAVTVQGNVMISFFSRSRIGRRVRQFYLWFNTAFVGEDILGLTAAGTGPDAAALAAADAQLTGAHLVAGTAEGGGGLKAVERIDRVRFLWPSFLPLPHLLPAALTTVPLPILS